MSKALLQFYSKKLAATFGAIIAVIAVPFVNRKFGLNLDIIEVTSTIGSVVVVALTYVIAQFKLDVKTEGYTSTAQVLEYVKSPAAPTPTPEVAKVAAVLAALAKPGSPLEEALKSLQPPANP